MFSVLYIIIFCIILYFIIIYAKFFKSDDKYIKNNNIEVLKSIYPPSIINDQSFHFVKTNYRDMSFSQCIRTNDFISDEIKKSGKWEECQDLFDIWNSSNKNGVVLDIGANIGSCSFLFAEVGVKVYAFEPLPNNLFLFSLTTFSNKNYNKLITIYPYALGKIEEKKKIKIEKSNWGCSSFYFNHHDYNEEIEVRVLNNFSDIIPKEVSIIKIDVEGAEYELLEGADYFLKSHSPENIYMEVQCGKKDSEGFYETEKIYKLLDKYGYEVSRKVDCSKTSYGNINARIKR